MSRISVLVVDDSATMRALIRHALLPDPDILVVGEAGNAQDARAAIKALNPDVITLDVEMPEMNGLDFLEHLMRLRPMPVVMVSGLTSKGAETTVRALEIGALDCVAKPSPAAPRSFDRLPQAIHAAAAARRTRLAVGAIPSGRTAQATPSGIRATSTRLIVMAASTGGVEALIQVFSELPPDAPPIAVVQHMPALFTGSFAQRLDRLSAVTVAEAVDGAFLKPGTAVIAPGGERHLEVIGASGGPLRCRLVASDPESGHRPSADRLFRSAARAAGARALGVILTGMGADGAAGLLAMRQAGAHTISQDEATSVVFGMPNAAQRLGAVIEQLPLEQIAAGIVRELRTSRHDGTRHALRQTS
jgi:two-component system chemotaxis response regulator CheB